MSQLIWDLNKLETLIRKKNKTITSILCELFVNIYYVIINILKRKINNV